MHNCRKVSEVDQDVLSCNSRCAKNGIRGGGGDTLPRPCVTMILKEQLLSVLCCIFYILLNSTQWERAFQLYGNFCYMCPTSHRNDDIISFFRFPNFNYTEELDIKKLPLQKSDYWSILAYNQSKLSNILFSMELNRRLAPQGVTSNAVHPGNMIYTSLAKNSWLYWMVYLLCRPFSKSPVCNFSVLYFIRGYLVIIIKR